MSAFLALLADGAAIRASAEMDAGGPPREISFSQAKRLVRGGTAQARWLADGTRFYFVDSGGAEPTLVLVDPDEDAVTSLADFSVLKTAIARFLDKDPSGVDLFGADFEDVEETHTVYLSVGGPGVAVDLANERVRYVNRLLDGADPALPKTVNPGFPATWPDEIEVSDPSGNRFAGTKDDDLRVRSRAGDVVELTKDGSEDRPWIMRGLSWSPDGRLLFAIRADLRGVGRLPLHDWQAPLSEPSYRPWPNVAGKQPEFSAGIFSMDGEHRRDVDFGDDPYYRVLGWRSDASEVLIATLSRDAKRVTVLAIDPASGDVRAVLTEESPTFIDFPPNVTHRGGVGFRLLGDNKHFVWASERTGWRHFYLYRLDGTLVRPLTRGEFPVVDFSGAELQTGYFFFTAASDPERPYDVHVHRGHLDGRPSVLLSKVTGQHTIQVAPSGEYYLDRHSSTGRLPVIELRRADGSLVRTLTRAALPEGVRFSAPEHFVAMAADGKTDIHGVILKPADFDPQKKYPVIENIYAGAFVTYVPHAFDSDAPWYGDYLFENGYVEVVIDGRGTPGRGKAFQDVVYLNMGRHEVADHSAALRQAAASRPWMDMSRVGIFGNSYGGYFTMRALLQAADTYHAGVVAGLPLMNGHTAATATECYLGLYSPDSAPWAYASNLRLIDGLQGEVLLVKGSLDVNTPLFGTMLMADALIKASKPVDMLVFPGANHHYRTADGSHRKYFMQSIVRHFDQHLR